MNKYKVYYHKVPKEISGYKYDKYYIGITCKKYTSDRWGKNGSGYKTQIFYRAIQCMQKIIYYCLKTQKYLNFAISVSQPFLQSLIFQWF